MGLGTKKKASKHAVDTEDMSEVYNEIIRGERPQPGLWSEERRKLSKWKKSHAPQAKRLERLWQAEQGIAPVAYQASKSRDRWGYRGRGSGRAGVVSALKEWQNVTNIAAAWGPNYVDAPAPAVGMPLGESTLTGKEVGFDAFSWYQQGLLGGNPSVFTLSLPGLGKSTMIRKILMGHAAQAQIPIIAGDIKAEYVSIVQRLGGQVITLGHGKGRLNPLDAGALGAIVPRLQDAGADKELIESVCEQVHGRQVNMMSSLLALGRQDRVEDYEIMAISIALRELMESDDYGWENPPTVQALIDFLERGSDELREHLRAEEDAVYDERITPLLLSLRSLLEGAVGRIFSGQTTTKIDVTSPAVCIDVSSIDRNDEVMKAAVLMACWSSAFGAIEAAHVMHDAGLGRQRLYAVTMDELWQVLAAAPGMVGQVDRLLRLNRTEGIATYLITHTVADLEALPTEQDIKTAKGFVERAGAVICGGLPRDEIDRLDGVIPFKDAEAAMIASWSQGTEPKRSRTAETPTPPGRGHFMIKPSKDGAAGIPIRTVLTPYEIEHRLHDTNQRFEELFTKVEGTSTNV